MNPFFFAAAQKFGEKMIENYLGGGGGTGGGGTSGGLPGLSGGPFNPSSPVGQNPYGQEMADRVSGGMTDMSNYPGAKTDDPWGEKLSHAMNNPKYQQIGMSGMNAQAPQASMQSIMGMARRTGQQPYQEFAPLNKGLGGQLSQYLAGLNRR